MFLENNVDNMVRFDQELADKMKADTLAFIENKKKAGPSLGWKDTLEGHKVKGAQMDASESMFLARQLEYIRAGVYKVEYPDLKGARLVPTNTSVPSGARSYTIRIWDKVGEADLVSEDASDFNTVEAKITEKTMRFFMIGLGYQYTLDEVRYAVEAGVPLQATKAMVCREQIERKMDDIILTGSTKASVTGLLNATDTGIVTYTASNSAALGTTLFSGKNADEILGDLHGLVHKVVQDSKEVDIPNTMLMPLTTRLSLQTRRVGDGTSTSILNFFQGNDPYINMIESLYQLESNTAWTGKRITVYRRDPTCLELINPQPFEQMAPFMANPFITKVLCRLRTGGIAIYRPTSIGRMDNI